MNWELPEDDGEGYGVGRNPKTCAILFGRNCASEEQLKLMSRRQAVIRFNTETVRWVIRTILRPLTMLLRPFIALNLILSSPFEPQFEDRGGRC